AVAAAPAARRHPRFPSRRTPAALPAQLERTPRRRPERPAARAGERVAEPGQPRRRSTARRMAAVASAMANALAAVAAAAPGHRLRRPRHHPDALAQPPQRPALAPARGAPQRAAPVRL